MTEYMERLVKAKDVYNDLYNQTNTFQSYGFSDKENLEVAANIIYLLGAIMNDEKIAITYDSPTNNFILSLPNDLYSDILPFINFVD